MSTWPGRHPFIVIIATLILTAGLAVGIIRLRLQMSIDLFVQPSSSVFKTTKMYQRYFGGDSIYLLLEGKQQLLISKRTVHDIQAFTSRAYRIRHITGGTNYISLIDEQLSRLKTSEPVFNQQAFGQMAAALSGGQTFSSSSYILGLLTNRQKQAVEEKALRLMTMGQKRRLIHTMREALEANRIGQLKPDLLMSGGFLGHNQLLRLQQEVLRLLNERQKQMLARRMFGKAPRIEQLNNRLLRTLVFSNHGHIPPPLRALIPRNGRSIVLILNMARGTDVADEVDVCQSVNKLLRQRPFAEGITVRAAGSPMIFGTLAPEILTTMLMMLTIAFTLMILVLSLVFRVRRRLITLLFIPIALLWTFGIMGWTGIPITLATMGTLPVIIGLGTDFGVQFHNRYEEEYRKSKDADVAFYSASSAIGHAIGMAVLIMALSFLTLLFARAPMMRQFGLTLAIGVWSCFLVERFMMMSVFLVLDRRLRSKSCDTQTCPAQGMGTGRVAHYSQLVGRFALPIVAVSTIIASCGLAAEASIPVETNIQDMIPQRLEALQSTRHFQQTVGSTTYLSFLICDQDVTRPLCLKWMMQVGRREVMHEKAVRSFFCLSSALAEIGGEQTCHARSTVRAALRAMPETLRKTLVADHNHVATLQFEIDPQLTPALQQRLLERLRANMNLPKGMQAEPAGTQMMMIQGLNDVSSGRLLMLSAGLGIIFLCFLAFYRQIRRALYTLLPILFVLGFSPLTLRMLGMGYNPITTSLSSLVLGIGIEFTILIIARFSEQQAYGQSTEQALQITLTQVAPAMLASGLTVIGGFSALLFVGFPMLQSFGLITVIDTAYSLLSALLILPALIRLFCKRRAL
ncbi:MAG: efflux RND transporter permease subunit [Sporolactobacillus sp.]